ncbi:DUF6204 family protein [Micromonospora sagamiensis]|uniref:Uncharacterized protein n=1 Tax=Micromonospora sagamiensis TaxID=47875 RepID=A0A562WNG1_9ACTN|nr:DUF6204 family protein [Micromonospora sagamiensis]TWJ30924.1 hypothetical protein JD81_04473 [Micromonospora sagamiensis]BCL16037.1 hypothetical protein GCM10017556_37760 [Micromonospora sagamiensis]
MARKSYQVIVRGRFAPLDDEQRAALLAKADEHDLLRAKFTEEGTVTYERSLLAFTFRCVVPATEEDDDAVVIGRAEALAVAAVRQIGADYRDLRSVSTDLDNIRIRRRGH